MDKYDGVQLAEEAVQCFRDTTGVPPDPLLAQIADGTYDFLTEQTGRSLSVQDACARSIVMAWYAMVTTQELGLAAACHGVT